MNHEQKQEQKITVKPDTLGNLIKNVARGEYRIPQFQREFVWTKRKIIELFDSIFREWPIGSFFLWDAEREYNHLFREIRELKLPPVGKHDNITFVLDGQQRITSLYVSLKGLVVKGTDYSRITFDLRDRRFTDRKADNTRYVAVCDMWGPGSMKLSRKIDEEYVDAYDKCWTTLQTYPVSLVEVRGKDLPAVCRIFQRINQSGKRLDRFDLISAMTFTDDFNLRDKFKEDVLAQLEKRGFGKISPAILTQLLALIKVGQCTERHEFGLTTEDISEHWDSAVAAIMLAADILRKSAGVVNSGFLPYDAILTLLAYYFAKSGNRALPSEHMQWFRRWFWRASFAQRYGAGGATRLGQDRELFDELIEGKQPEFAPPMQLSAASLARVRMTQTRSAIRNAFLCLLATQKPVHLVNNSEIGLLDGSISDFTSSEKHHIFPKAHLERHGPPGAEIHSLPNFCFLPAELNKRILDSKPSDYFEELRSENALFDKAASTHLLPTGPDVGVADNDYLKFLNARSALIIEEIRRLCGEITTPRRDERQEVVTELEDRLRDCIDNRLTRLAGARYWKTNVPPAVRDEAEKRIKAAVAKYPDVTEEELAEPRRRLDYCNVMDYRTIIENGVNWPTFEDIFRKKQDLQTYLAGFSEYRNVIMHNRDMTELVEKNGEAAMIWLSHVLPYEEDEETPEDAVNEVAVQESGQ